MGLAFRFVGDGVWEEDSTNPQFQIQVKEGWGVILRDTFCDVCMTAGEANILDNDGNHVASLSFKPHACSDPPPNCLPEWFALVPTSDLCASYWTVRMDFDRKGIGCWVLDGGESCDCPRYHECIQFDPPYGCANCDERFSQFYPVEKWMQQ